MVQEAVQIVVAGSGTGQTVVAGLLAGSLLDVFGSGARIISADGLTTEAAEKLSDREIGSFAV